ncbi:MAG: 2-hydroxyglutaryl-CoA dehydratase, partial [Defluviitaleaceae bacterium]|nr:2-hydroxyglutaryl-CoA dehydratase [Defluviitaleaceae bacterium]
SKLADNVAREDVAAGAMVSIGQRVAGMAARVGVAEAVIMTGGVALNRAMLGVLADEFQVEVTTTDSPQIVGALGAAVFAMELYKKTTK